MDRRRPLLVNDYEVATDAALQDAASRFAGRICPKVRIADAVAIRSSGLTDDEYSYALRAHFDFVIAEESGLSAFAVEFDGPDHDWDIDAIHRDSLKESICDKLEMPLLRVDAQYLGRIRWFKHVGWLAEIWVLYDGFFDAQRRGAIPYDEPFCYTNFFGAGYMDGGRFVELDFKNPPSMEQLRDIFENKKELLTTTPYDPFLSSRVLIRKLQQKGICSNHGPEITVADDPRGYTVAIAIVELPNGSSIVGYARCRSFRFPPVGPWELAKELAVVDAAEKLKETLRGKDKSSSASEVEKWRNRLRKWKGWVVQQ